MSENENEKDQLENNNAQSVTEEAVENTEGAESTENTPEGYVSQFDELETKPEGKKAAVTTENAAEEPKKKGKAGKIIVITLIVLIVIGMAIGAYFLFCKPTLQGNWKYENGDTTVYYTFTDKQITISAGNEYAQQTATYDYELVTEESATMSDGSKDTRAKFNILISGQVAATYDYTLSGYDLTGKSLELIQDDGTGTASSSSTTTMNFTSVKNIDLGTIQPIDGFKADDKLTGTWSNPNVNFKYVFGGDGIIQTINTSSSNTVFKCAYTVDGTTVSAKTAADGDPTTFDFTYDGDNRIVISDTTFVREDQNGELLDTIPESATTEDTTSASSDASSASSDSETSSAADESSAATSDSESSAATDGATDAATDSAAATDAATSAADESTVSSTVSSAS